MSAISWIDSHQMVMSLDCHFPRRAEEPAGNIAAQIAYVDGEAETDQTPGECYVYDRFRGIVIEFKSAR
jgi:hypothetical protein